MKTIRDLKIKDWCDYIFNEMVNINDIQPEYFMINNFKDCKNGSVLLNVCYCEENNVPHIVFDDNFLSVMTV